MFKTLEILGLRGFAKGGIISFAEPNGKPGSGLTIIVGANNSGKSTIIEALRALAQRTEVSITQGRRNLIAGDKIELTLTDFEHDHFTLRSISNGSSETVFEQTAGPLIGLIVLPSRRSFHPYFHKGLTDISGYMRALDFPSIRQSSIDQFSSRLFNAHIKKAEFNKELIKVINPVPDWSIDQLDSGQYFLKITTTKATHSSEGLGDGLVSLFIIIDALYESKQGQSIAIDEPELSLHPALQRKLMVLLADYAKDRQIILSTHSPYFVHLDSILNGGTIARVHIEENSSVISQLDRNTIDKLSGLIKNDNNPHILGLNAQEVFFMDDGIILVEGQEDVIFYKRILEKLVIQLNGNILGWGVGGATNMKTFAEILKALGFKKVVGILDNNKSEDANRLQEEYPDYHFFPIPADDVRTKAAVQARGAKPGLLDDKNEEIRAKYVESLTRLFNKANEYLSN